MARMQVAKPHAGHTHLVHTAQAASDQTLVLLGDRDKIPGKQNPLPGYIRVAMVREHFPTVTQVAIHPDTPDDAVWSKNLDNLIKTLFPDYDVTLFCSRDGFVDYYSGQFRVQVIDAVPSESGTAQRETILSQSKSTDRLSEDFRRGYITAVSERHPIVFSTVDAAVMNANRTHIWLGQKAEDAGLWRFPGGFVDPSDTSRAAAAVREASEELGNIQLDNLIYIGSHQCNDFRYRDEADSVMTDLFLMTHTWGQATASDDLDDIMWCPLSELNQRLIVAHQPLGRMLLEHLRQGT